MVGARRWLDDREPLDWTLLAGSAFGLGGLLAGAVLTNLIFSETYADPVDADALVLVAGAGAGASLLGGLLCCRLVEVPRTASFYRGGSVGVLTGLLANFVAWFAHFVWSLATRGMDGSLLEVLGTMASYVLIIGGTSLVVTGVVTAPVGAAIGIGLARLRRSGLDAPRGTDLRDELPE